MSRPVPATMRAHRDAIATDERIGPAAPEAPDVVTASDDYARRFAGPIGAWFLRVQERIVLQMLHGRPHASVLEVGGGHGQLTGTLARAGHEVTVLGSEPKCRQRIQPLVDRGACRFVTGRLLSLPYSDRAFDVVIALRLLAHLESWPQFIGELTRVARHAVIVDYATARSVNLLTPGLFVAKRAVEQSTRRYQVFREQEILEAFSAHGFVCRERVPQFVLPMALHRLGQSPPVSRSLEAVCRVTGLTWWFGSPVLGKFSPAGADGRAS